MTWGRGLPLSQPSSQHHSVDILLAYVLTGSGAPTPDTAVIHLPTQRIPTTPSTTQRQKQWRGMAVCLYLFASCAVETGEESSKSLSERKNKETRWSLGSAGPLDCLLRVLHASHLLGLLLQALTTVPSPQASPKCCTLALWFPVPPLPPGALSVLPLAAIPPERTLGSALDS